MKSYNRGNGHSPSSLLQINYTLLRLSHIHEVFVQIDTEAEPGHEAMLGYS